MPLLLENAKGSEVKVHHHDSLGGWNDILFVHLVCCYFSTQVSAPFKAYEQLVQKVGFV
jgi:hypothetical protein